MSSINQATVHPESTAQRLGQWLKQRPSLQLSNGIILAYINLLLVAFDLYPNPDGLSVGRYIASFALLVTIGIVTIGLTELPNRFFQSWINTQIGRWVPVLLYTFLALLTSWVGQLIPNFLLMFFPIVISFSLPRLRDIFYVHVAVVILWFLTVWLYDGSLLAAYEETIDLLFSLFWISGILLLLRKQAEANAYQQESQKRANELTLAEERVHMAREIHDGLGHHLTALDIQLRAASKLMERDPEQLAATLADCQQETRAAMQEVRRSVSMMRHAPLEGQTVVETLAQLVADFSRSSPLTAHFMHHGESRSLTSSAAMTLYRAVQEGLTNAQKHAQDAQNVTVTLSFLPEGIDLAICDDGTEPAPSLLPNIEGNGYGLIGLRERVEHLGGTVQAGLDGAQGFKLHVSLPLENKDMKKQGYEE